jgi:hypothetical protein
MNDISKEIWDKIFTISVKVKNNLKNKGFVIPIQEDDGSIRIGFYFIKKENNFYSIYNTSNNIVVDNINLPQSAILIANSLALGKFMDKNILELDRNYGYSLFEEQLKNRSKKKNIETLEIRKMKSDIATVKKQRCLGKINEQFNKLSTFV